MIFELTGTPEAYADAVDRVYEDPRIAKADRDHLRQLVPGVQIAILCGGKRLSEEALEGAIRSYEIQEMMTRESRIPSTFRKGWGGERDDFATGPSGTPTRVWRPRNPEDERE